MFKDEKYKEFYLNRLVYVVKHGTGSLIPKFNNHFIRGFYPEDDTGKETIRVILDNLNFFHINDIRNIPEQFNCENEMDDASTCFLDIDKAGKFYLERCKISLNNCLDDIKRKNFEIQEYEQKIKDETENKTYYEIKIQQILNEIKSLKDKKNCLDIIMDSY